MSVRVVHLGSAGVARRRALTGAAAATVLAVGLGLSGCGVGKAGAAAIVDGERISDTDVQTAAAETNKGVEQPLQTPFTAESTLPWLILAPFVLDEAEREGKAVSEDQARKALPKLDDPSPATVEFVRAYIAAQSSLSDEGVQNVLKAVDAASISVNPRYGTFNPKQPAQLTQKLPPWIATPEPTSPTSIPGLSGGGRPSDG